MEDHVTAQSSLSTVHKVMMVLLFLCSTPAPFLKVFLHSNLSNHQLLKSKLLIKLRRISNTLISYHLCTFSVYRHVLFLVYVDADNLKLLLLLPPTSFNLFAADN